MQQYKADLHIHTLLSPCGDLEMTPANIVKRAAELNFNIIGITDHNSTKHCELIKKMAEQKGIFTLCGAEVTTKEETHCLTFFENHDLLNEFQKFLDEFLPAIKNNPDYFGHQVVIDENEMIIEEVENLLITGITRSIDQVEAKVHELNGLFIPAHIDRQKFSLISQLGFVPPDLNADAFEITGYSSKEDIIQKFPYIKDKTFIRSSDAHRVEGIGIGSSIFEIETLSFDEIKKALAGIEGRGVLINN